MFGAEGNDAALPGAERNRVVSESHVKRAAPHHHGFGGVAMTVPTACNPAFDPDEPNFDPAQDALVLAFSLRRQSLE